MSNKEGYFKYLLAIDCETSGLQFRNPLAPDKAHDGGYYQPVAWGIQVVDSITLKAVEELYVEIKWDGISKWDAKAEAVHGLSKGYLEEHGVSEEDAVCMIGSLIMKYWADSNLNCLGHNVVSFDIPFLHSMFTRHDVHLRFSNRHYDTNTFALIFSESFTSDAFFEMFGLEKRGVHNALTDIQYTVECARKIKNIFNLAIQG